MEKAVPLIAAINDLSGFGRCSLTVSLPILSVMGFQVCPMPTAILSNHTGYESCFFEDFTDQMKPFIEEWKKRGLHFAAIYTGFLGSAAQEQLIMRFLDAFREPETLVLVDPVMADDGKMYSTYNEALCNGMRMLTRAATVITPNLTEACILSRTDYSALARLSGAKLRTQVELLARSLTKNGASRVVITGVRGAHDSHTIANVAFDGQTGHGFTVETPALPQSYSGTGDVFASVLCGAMTNGVSFKQSVKIAAEFVMTATKYCCENKLSTRDGVAFEPFLAQLLKTRKGDE